MQLDSLFADLPFEAVEEVLTDLVRSDGFRLVRIVSDGQSTPQDEWYDQVECEWVVLIRGSAGLLFEGDAAPRTLSPGDFVHIPPHRKHRVAWTDPEDLTVWLALYYSPTADG